MRAFTHATALVALLALPTAGSAQTGPAQTAEPEHVLTSAPEHKRETLSLTEDQQKVLIEWVVMSHNQLPTPPEFKPAVRAEVPKAVQISAFSHDITSEMPALKEYWYAHLDRDIILVDGMALTVAAVVPLPQQLWANERKPNPQQEALNWAGGLAGLSKEQKQELYQALAPPAETTGSASNGAVQPAPGGIAIRAHIDLPADVQTTPVPQALASRFQQFAGFGFAKLQDGRVIIADPQRHVVGLITEAEGQGSSPNAQPGSRDPLRNLEVMPNASAYTGPGSKR